MVRDIKLILSNSKYFPGSVIQGELVISIDKPKKYHSIAVTLFGRAMVRWEEVQGRTATIYKNSATYIEAELAVWKADDSPTGELAPAEHRFPFSFQLPANIPPSFKGRHGEVKYEAESRITHSGLIKSMTKSKHQVKVQFTVGGALPDARTLSHFSAPFTSEKTKQVGVLCFKSGSIIATAKVPCAIFSPGEVIPISVHISNQSSKRIRVASLLHREDEFISTKSITDSNLISKTISLPILPGVTTSYEDQNLTIPTDVYLTMKNCSCIKVEYVLTIVVVIPWSFNMVLRIPVVVAIEGFRLAVESPAVLVNLQSEDNPTTPKEPLQSS